MPFLTTQTPPHLCNHITERNHLSDTDIICKKPSSVMYRTTESWSQRGPIWFGRCEEHTLEKRFSDLKMATRYSPDEFAIFKIMES